MGRPPLIQQLLHLRGQLGVARQLASPGPLGPRVRRPLRLLGPIPLRAAATGQLPLNGSGMPAQPTSRLRDTRPPPENNRITTRSNHETPGTLASTINRSVTHPLDVPNAGYDQAFMTGPTGPGQTGYVLTKLEFTTLIINELTVSIWTDSNGSRDQKLAEQTLTGDGSFLQQDLSADSLSVFLLPETQYWIRYETVGQTRLPLTTLADDPETLAGWSIDGPNKVRLRLSGFATTRGTLVSNLNGTHSQVVEVLSAGLDQAFTTGPTEPGYVLTELEINTAIVNQLKVSIWTDSNGSRGDKLAEQTLTGDGVSNIPNRLCGRLGCVPVAGNPVLDSIRNCR